MQKQAELSERIFATGFENSVFAPAEKWTPSARRSMKMEDKNIKPGLMRSSAFVSFSTLRSAQASQQIMQTENSLEMDITEVSYPYNRQIS
jgi:hypothetical protein